jgi:putative tryptophan/tyrosine transport system substrate-binding protein
MNVRRRLIGTLGAAVFAAPWRVLAQTPARSYRIGWLSTSAGIFKEPYSLAFVQRLGELGLVEGKNLTLERRYASGSLDNLPAVAAELARAKCDLYFIAGSELTLAALTGADRTTPIVLVAVDFDPVTTGDVNSLARPGGRVTGITALQSVLPAKRLELLKEMLPAARKVAVFSNDQTQVQLTPTQGTARRLGIDLQVIDFKKPPFDYKAGFAEAKRAKANALFVLGSALWVPDRRRITDMALAARLPTVFHQAQWVDFGGLMSYGFNFPALWRRGADIVAAVLRGGKPAEIPMEQPTTYELVVNLKTARTLGITIPQAFLVRADRVIE